MVSRDDGEPCPWRAEASAFRRHSRPGGVPPRARSRHPRDAGITSKKSESFLSLRHWDLRPEIARFPRGRDVDFANLKHSINRGTARGAGRRPRPPLASSPRAPLPPPRGSRGRRPPAGTGRGPRAGTAPAGRENLPHAATCCHMLPRRAPGGLARGLRAAGDSGVGGERGGRLSVRTGAERTPPAGPRRNDSPSSPDTTARKATKQTHSSRASMDRALRGERTERTQWPISES